MRPIASTLAPLALTLLALLAACGSNEGEHEGADEITQDASSGSSGASESGTSDSDSDSEENGTNESDTGTSEADTTSESETEGGPAAGCEGPGAAGHLRLVSTYWAGTTAFGDHLDELAPALQVGHVDLARLASPLPDDVDVIVDLHWELFDYQQHTLRADVDTQIDAITAAVEPVRERVRAFYLIDEPYVAGHAIPRSEIEAAIMLLEQQHPDIPTYATFAHHCFDPASLDPACVVPSEQRGIPEGLDWVGFDWYNDSNDLALAGTHVATNIAPGIDRIVELASGVGIILVPEAYTDGNRLESTVVATLHDYFVLAADHEAVIGVDFFLWADAPQPENFLGTRSLPSARAALRGFARWIRRECGDPAPLVPVTQWYDPLGPDHRYEPWLFDGRSLGYRVDGVAFVLVSVEDAQAVPLYHCLVDRGSSVDSLLTLDAGCEAAPLAAPATVIGALYPQEQPGTVPLHRYAQQQAPWDHAYATSPNAALPPGYAYEYAVGWVLPASAL